MSQRHTHCIAVLIGSSDPSATMVDFGEVKSRFTSRLVVWSFHDIIVQGQIRVAPHSFHPIYQESIALFLTFPRSPRSLPSRAPSTTP